MQVDEPDFSDIVTSLARATLNSRSRSQLSRGQPAAPSSAFLGPFTRNGVIDHARYDGWLACVVDLRQEGD